MSKLTTHILDTYHGTPAAEVSIELWRLDTDEDSLILETSTNSDGRTDHPLLEGGSFEAGNYELLFKIGPYFESKGVASEDIRFLDTIPIRFGISNPQAHYHVPLLASPWSYSTYRGS
ncbi:MAG: hydroxyisourate hydrolase [Verrucomicrobiota bacterium]